MAEMQPSSCICDHVNRSTPRELASLPSLKVLAALAVYCTPKDTIMTIHFAHRWHTVIALLRPAALLRNRQLLARSASHLIQAVTLIFRQLVTERKEGRSDKGNKSHAGHRTLTLQGDVPFTQTTPQYVRYSTCWSQLISMNSPLGLGAMARILVMHEPSRSTRSRETSADI